MRHSLKTSEKLPEIDSAFHRAEKLREKSFYLQALRLFRKALRGYASLHDHEGEYNCLLSLGDTYRMVGSFDLAVQSYTEAIDIAGAFKSAVKAADAKVGLGLSLRAQGKWKEALQLIRQSKNTYRKKKDMQGVAFTLWAEAGALRIKGDIPGAISTYKQSYEIFKDLKDNQGIGYCLCGLGGASRIAGLFKDSLKYYISANRLFSKTGDTFGRAYSYCGMGNAYRMLRDFRNAFDHFAKAVRIYKKIGDKVSFAYTLWGLSTAYKMAGKLEVSHDHLLKAMALFKKTKDPRGMIYCRLGLGEIALITGRKAVAQRHLSAAQTGLNEYNFAVEKCFAKTLISSISGKFDNTCYSRLGLKLGFQELPLNIP